MSDGRLIPENTVWKFVFEISHAPHYVREFDNGTFAGIYAPVEHVERDNAVPFGISRDVVLEKKNSDHVDVVEVEKENSPWAKDAYRQEENDG